MASDTPYPYFSKGMVVKGFGRGGKQLGMPTANLDSDAVKELPEALGTGVYYGFARVNAGEVYRMVMSIGTNPFFQNKERSMEVHLLHEFSEDFYGAELRLVILGFVRPMSDFPSLDALIAAMKNDVVVSHRELAKDENVPFQHNTFFKQWMHNNSCLFFLNWGI